MREYIVERIVVYVIEAENEEEAVCMAEHGEALQVEVYHHIEDVTEPEIKTRTH